VQTLSGLIDINAVLGSWPKGDAPTVTTASLLDQMDRLGIDRALVRHSDSIAYDAEEGNLRLLAAITDNPRLLPAFVVGPLDCGEHGGPGAFVDLLDKHRVVAVWIYPTSHGWSVRGSEAQTLLDQLSIAGRPVLVDLSECGWEDAEYLATAIPDVDIVLCSVGYRTLRQAYAVMQRHPRIHLDTSYLAADDALELVASRFGAHRLIFGTGSPLYDAGGAVHRLMHSGWNTVVRESVGSRTACALLSLEVRAVSKATPSAATLDYPIVDAHAHIGRWPSSWVPRPDAEHLLDSMNASATGIAIASSMAAIWSGEVRSGNDAACAAALLAPGRIYVHAVANPHRVEDRPYLDALLQRDEVLGIKVHSHTHGCALNDARYDWIWELAIRHDVPVLGHSFFGTWHSDPSLFGIVAHRNPELTLVVGHSGAMPEGFRATIIAASSNDNLIAEVCGSSMTGWWLRRLVDAMGSHRVLHGTDATLIDPRYGVGRVLYSPLNEEERRFVLSANTRRLYHLTNPAQR
jgi:predicted TIM-barrel fold metal-dependent hydrolase